MSLIRRFQIRIVNLWTQQKASIPYFRCTTLHARNLNANASTARANSPAHNYRLPASLRIQLPSPCLPPSTTVRCGNSNTTPPRPTTQEKTRFLPHAPRPTTACHYRASPPRRRCTSPECRTTTASRRRQPHPRSRNPARATPGCRPRLPRWRSGSISRSTRARLGRSVGFPARRRRARIAVATA